MAMLPLRGIGHFMEELRPMDADAKKKAQKRVSFSTVELPWLMPIDVHPVCQWGWVLMKVPWD